MLKLGVNIDHVATVREARKIAYPDPVAAAAICELAGAHWITAHLREDRRHIQDRDVRILREIVQTKFNLEMANVKEIVDFALKIKPDECTFVPERREEITTEGGLDVVTNLKSLTDTVKKLQDAGIIVSLFIDPEEKQIEAAAKTGAKFIELHTGAYSNAKTEAEQKGELGKLVLGAEKAAEIGLRINAGHGLNYTNVVGMHRIPMLETLHIGHSIVARAIFVGLERAVKEMLDLLRDEKSRL